MLSCDKDLKAQIIQRIRSFDIRNQKIYHEKYPRPFKIAAVLLPLKVYNGEVFILLTKRAKTLRSHASETAFPGGMMDESDDSVTETALREADEEIGLPSSSVEIIAVLSRGIVVSGTIIYPVVGFISDDFQPNVNPSEVDLAFYMPMKSFLCQEKLDMFSYPLKFANYIGREVWYKSGDREVRVWGFTYSFCTLLAKIIFDDSSCLQMIVGCVDSGRVSDCVEQYFRLCYNWILADSCSKL